MASMTQFLKRYGLRLIGIGFALVLYLRLDRGRIGDQIQHTDLVFFLSALICVNMVVVIQAWRGYILLGEAKGKLTFGAYAHSYFVTMAASAALPGRIGSVAQVPLLKKQGIGIGVGFANVIYDKLYDLAGFLIMGALFAMLLVSSGIAVKPGLLVSLSMIVLVLIWYIDIIFVFASGQIRRLLPSSISSWGEGGLILSPRIKGYALLLTLVRLGGAIIVHWFCARAAGLNLPLVLVGAAAAFGALSTLIPLSVMGVGFREGVFLFLLSGMGLSEEQILTFAFLLLLSYLSTVFIGTLVAILDKKKGGNTA